MIKEYYWLAADTQAICATQTVAAPVFPAVVTKPLVMNGTYVSRTENDFPYFRYKGVYRSVSITSTNNLSGVNFFITGYYKGNLKTVTLVGPNNGTVDSGINPIPAERTIFEKVTSIIADGAATGVSIGSGVVGITVPFGNDADSLGTSYALQAEAIQPTLHFAAYATLNNVSTDEAPATQTLIPAGTGTAFASGTIPYRYIWFQVNPLLASTETGSGLFTLSSNNLSQTT